MLRVFTGTKKIDQVMKELERIDFWPKEQIIEDDASSYTY
jgi:hypothetical protein